MIVGTRQNSLNKAFLTFTHNLCLEETHKKKKTHQNIFIFTRKSIDGNETSQKNENQVPTS